MNFWNNLENFDSRVALLEDNLQATSYAELAKAADELAKQMGSDRSLVAIKCGNNLHSIVGYLACLRAGHVAMLIPKDLDTEAVTILYHHYGFNWEWGPGTQGYVLKPLNPSPVLLHVDLALLLSTSGSTGSPKLVKLTYHNLASNAAAIASYLVLSEEEKPITTLPPAYSYGLSVLNSHLLVGAKILLTETALTNRAFWDFFQQQKATSFSGVPYTYSMLKRLGFEKMELPHLHYFTQAGGKLAAELVEFFANVAIAKGQRFYVMYGQTEATARIAYLPPEAMLKHSGSIGQAIPGGQLWIVDDQDQELQTPFTQGELLYTGPNVMLGYAQSKEDLSKGDSLNGILHTGDIAYRDEDGFFYVIGRKKRFIKIMGNRINLDEIEVYLKNQGLNAVATGQDDLLIVALLGQEVAQAQQLIKNKYHFHHSVVRVYSTREIPRSASGKVLYQKLFQQWMHSEA